VFDLFICYLCTKRNFVNVYSKFMIIIKNQQEWHRKGKQKEWLRTEIYAAHLSLNSNGKFHSDLVTMKCTQDRNKRQTDKLHNEELRKCLLQNYDNFQKSTQARHAERMVKNRNLCGTFVFKHEWKIPLRPNFRL